MYTGIILHHPPIFPQAASLPRVYGDYPTDAPSYCLTQSHYPVYTGIILVRRLIFFSRISLPRVYGDYPYPGFPIVPLWGITPCIRGLSLCPVVNLGGECHYPVYTGIIPATVKVIDASTSLPRVYGDYPGADRFTLPSSRITPCIRGLSYVWLCRSRQGSHYPVYTGIILGLIANKRKGKYIPPM